MDTYNQKGLGPNSAGQSGDTQGISGDPESSSKSVEELLEEGQYTEAGILEGIEDSNEGDPTPLETNYFPETEILPEDEDDDLKP